MNKFIFKISLVNNEKYTLVIEILQLDERFISDSHNLKDKPFCYFEDSKNFYIYSQNDGFVFNDGLEIPEYCHLFTDDGKFKGAKIIHEFSNDDKRYLYLKSLYRCLTEWSNNYGRFKNDKDITNRITLCDEFWIR
jgi:hypothetical protein